MGGGWWARLNGDFVENKKVVGLSDRAFRLHVAGLCHTARNLDDGYLSARSVKVVCALTAATSKHVTELRDARLWIPREDDGFEIKDYLLHNPRAETLKELRDARREAGRKGGIRSGEVRQAKRKANASSKNEAGGSNHGTGTKEPPKAVTALEAQRARANSEQPEDLDFQIPADLLERMP